jgi:hypothetical protein
MERSFAGLTIGGASMKYGLLKDSLHVSFSSEIQTRRNGDHFRNHDALRDFLDYRLR